MPIYEYHCNNCGLTFEKIVSASDSKEAVQCEKCASLKVVKTISAGSYRLSTSSGSSLPSGALSGCSSSSGFS